MYRLRAKRTTGANPPAELLFGELAYSDANKRLYVGRSNGSPCTFESDLSLEPLTTGLATLEAGQGTQDAAIHALQVDQGNQDSAIHALQVDQGTQDAQIATLSNDVITLETSQATQGTVLSGLLATTQDQAATLANLATVATTGAYNDLTGKPSLATVATTGAYNDLAGRPAIPFGFTYDQQTEPTAPPVGATWRERAASGLILNNWQWDGTYWEEPLTQSQVAYAWPDSLSASGPSVANPIPTPSKVLGYSLNTTLANSPQDANNFWFFRGFEAATIFDTRTLPGILTDNYVSATAILAQPFIVINSPNLINHTLLRVTKVSSAGSLRRGAFIVLYRRIRL